MAALILDAGVLLGLLDVADSHHDAAADEVEAADQASTRLLTPASGYTEALVSFARADRLVDAREAIAAMGISVEPLIAAIAELAVELRAGHQRRRLPDAIVLAIAVRLSGRLLTYDGQLSRTASKISDRTSRA